MDSLYLAHPYNRPPGRVINGVLYHYGIPGMQWGKRRFQNKDGSLTEAGKRRYAKSARGHIRSKEGDVKGFLKEGVSQAFAPQDRVRLKASYKKLLDDLGDADNAKTKLKSITYEKTQKKFDEEVANNPDMYKGILKGKARDKLRSRLSEEAMQSARDENPDLVRRIDAGSNATKAWNNVCRDATDKLLGQYGNQKVRMFSSETVGDVLSSTLEKIVIEEWYD